jgi:uncharacterized protein
MPFVGITRRLLLALALYLTFCSILGVLIADGALHPARRPLMQQEEAEVRQLATEMNARLQDVSVTAPDGAVLNAWLINADHSNGDSVIILHGLGDNRFGMVGYAQLFLVHRFNVLLPDARAHGTSGGEIATYGLLERKDILRWLEFLAKKDHPRCIFGFGESMGAAQLLQTIDAGAPFCAVAAESSFSNFREIAYDRMGQPFHLGPWFGRTLLRPVVEADLLRAQWKYKLDMSQVSPETSVRASNIPILLIHGQIDSNIPVRHSRRIHSRNPNTILWEVPNADHCGAISADPQEFEQKVIAFFSSTPGTAGTGN